MVVVISDCPVACRTALTASSVEACRADAGMILALISAAASCVARSGIGGGGGT